jgi:hypothetical protein
MDRNDNPGRREFLKSAGLAGVGAAVAVPAAMIGEAEARESPEEQVKGRYRPSAHVERFYFLNRL